MSQNPAIGPIVDKIRALAAPLVAHPPETPVADPVALSEVIDLIKPLVSTVAQPVQIRYPSDPLDENVKTYHDLRGIKILDGYTKKIRGDDKYNEFGEYIGLLLVLFPTGLRLLNKEGYWTRYPGDRSWWRIVEEREMSVEEAIRWFGYWTIVMGLAEVFDRWDDE